MNSSTVKRMKEEERNKIIVVTKSSHKTPWKLNEFFPVANLFVHLLCQSLSIYLNFSYFSLLVSVYFRQFIQYVSPQIWTQSFFLLWIDPYEPHFSAKMNNEWHMQNSWVLSVDFHFDKIFGLRLSCVLFGFISSLSSSTSSTTTPYIFYFFFVFIYYIML